MPTPVPTISSYIPSQLVTSKTGASRLVFTGSNMTADPIITLKSPAGDVVTISAGLDSTSKGSRAVLDIPSSSDLNTPGSWTVEYAFPQGAPVALPDIQVVQPSMLTPSIIPMRFEDGDLLLKMQSSGFAQPIAGNLATQVFLRPVNKTQPDLLIQGTVSTEGSFESVSFPLTAKVSNFISEVGTPGSLVEFELIFGDPDTSTPFSIPDLSGVFPVAIESISPSMVCESSLSRSLSVTFKGLSTAWPNLPAGSVDSLFKGMGAGLIPVGESASAIDLTVEKGNGDTDDLKFVIPDNDSASGLEKGSYHFEVDWEGFKPASKSNSISSLVLSVYTLNSVGDAVTTESYFPASVDPKIPILCGLEGDGFCGTHSLTIRFDSLEAGANTLAPVTAAASVLNRNAIEFMVPDFGGVAGSWEATLVVDEVDEKPPALSNHVFYSWTVSSLSPDVIPYNVVTTVPVPSKEGVDPIVFIRVAGKNLGSEIPCALRFVQGGETVYAQSNREGTAVDFAFPQISRVGKVDVELRHGSLPFLMIGSVAVIGADGVVGLGASVAGGSSFSIELSGVDPSVGSSWTEAVCISFGAPDASDRAICMGEVITEGEEGEAKVMVQCKTPALATDALFKDLGKALFAGVGQKSVSPLAGLNLGRFAARLERPVYLSVQGLPWMDTNYVQSFFVPGGPQPSFGFKLKEKAVLQGLNFLESKDYVVVFVPFDQPRSALADLTQSAVVCAQRLNLSELLYEFAPPSDKPMQYDLYVAEKEAVVDGAVLVEDFGVANTALNFNAFTPRILCLDCHARQDFAYEVPLVPSGASETLDTVIYCPGVETVWSTKLTKKSEELSMLSGTTVQSRSTEFGMLHFGLQGHPLSVMSQWVALYYSVDELDRSILPAGTEEPIILTLSGQNFPTAELTDSIHRQMPDLRELIPSYTAYIQLRAEKGDVIDELTASIQSSSVVQFEVKELPAGPIDVYLGVTADGAAMPDHFWPDLPCAHIFAYSAKSLSPALVSAGAGARVQVVGDFPKNQPLSEVDVTLKRIDGASRKKGNSQAVQARLVSGSYSLGFTPSENSRASNNHTENLVGKLDREGVLSLVIPDGMPTGRYSASLQMSKDVDLPPTVLKSALAIYAFRGLRVQSYGSVGEVSKVSITGCFSAMAEDFSGVAGKAEVWFGQDPVKDPGRVISLTRTQMVCETPVVDHANSARIFARLDPYLPWEEIAGQYRFVEVDPSPKQIVHVGQRSVPILLTGHSFPQSNPGDITVRLLQEGDNISALETTGEVTGSDEITVVLPTERIESGRYLEGSISFDTSTYLPIPNLKVFAFEVWSSEPAAAAPGDGVLELTGVFTPDDSFLPQYFLRAVPRLVGDKGRLFSPDAATAARDAVVVKAKNVTHSELAFGMPNVVVGGDGKIPYPAFDLEIAALPDDSDHDADTPSDDAWMPMESTVYTRQADELTPAFCFAGVENWLLTIQGRHLFLDSGEKAYLAFDVADQSSPSPTALYVECERFSDTEMVANAPNGLAKGSYTVWISWGGGPKPSKRQSEAWRPLLPDGGFEVFGEMHISPVFSPVIGGAEVTISLPDGIPAGKAAGASLEVTFGSAPPIKGTLAENGAVVIKTPSVSQAGPVPVSVKFETESGAVPVDHPFDYYSIDDLINPIRLVKGGKSIVLDEAQDTLSIQGASLPRIKKSEVKIDLIQGDVSTSINGAVSSNNIITAKLSDAGDLSKLGFDLSQGGITVNASFHGQRAVKLPTVLRLVKILGTDIHTVAKNESAQMTISGVGLFGDGLAKNAFACFGEPSSENFSKIVAPITFEEPYWKVTVPEIATAGGVDIYVSFVGLEGFGDALGAPNTSQKFPVPMGADVGDASPNESIKPLYVFDPLFAQTQVFPMYGSNQSGHTAGSSYGLIDGVGFPLLHCGADLSGKPVVTRPSIKLIAADGTTEYTSSAIMSTGDSNPSIVYAPPVVPAGTYKTAVSFDEQKTWVSVRKGDVTIYEVQFPTNSPDFDLQILPIKLGFGDYSGTKENGADPSSGVAFYVNKTATDITSISLQAVNLTAGQQLTSGDPVALRANVNGTWRCIKTILGDAVSTKGTTYGWYVDDNSPEFPDELAAIFSLRGIRSVSAMTVKDVTAMTDSMKDRWGRPPLPEFVPKIHIDYLGRPDGWSDTSDDPKSPAAAQVENEKAFYQDSERYKETGKANPYLQKNGNVPLPVDGASVMVTPLSYDQEVHPAVVDIYNKINDFTKMSLKENIGSLADVVSTRPGLSVNQSCGAFGIFKLSMLDAAQAPAMPFALPSTDNVVSAATVYTDSVTGLSFAADLPAGRAQQIYYLPPASAVAAGGPPTSPVPAWLPLVSPRQALVATSGKGNIRCALLDQPAFAAGKDARIALFQEQTASNALVVYLCTLSGDRQRLTYQATRMIDLGADSVLYGYFDVAVSPTAADVIHLVAMPHRLTIAQHYTVDAKLLNFDPDVSTGPVKATKTEHFLGLEGAIEKNQSEGDRTFETKPGSLRAFGSARQLKVRNNSFTGSTKQSYVVTVPSQADQLSWSCTLDRGSEPVQISSVEAAGADTWTSLDDCIDVQLEPTAGSEGKPDGGNFYFSLYPPKIDSPLFDLQNKGTAPKSQLLPVEFGYTGSAGIQVVHRVVADPNSGRLNIAIDGYELGNDAKPGKTKLPGGIIWSTSGDDWFKSSPIFMGIKWKFQRDPGVLTDECTWKSLVQPSTWAVDAFVGAPSILITKGKAASDCEKLIIAAPTSNDGRVVLASVPLDSGSKSVPTQELTHVRVRETGLPELGLINLDSAKQGDPVMIWKGLGWTSKSWSDGLTDSLTTTEMDAAKALFSDFYKNDDWMVIDPGRLHYVSLDTTSATVAGEDGAGVRLGKLPSDQPSFYSGEAGTNEVTLAGLAAQLDDAASVWTSEVNPYKDLLNFVAPPLLRAEGCLSQIVAQSLPENLANAPNFVSSTGLTAALGTDALHTGLFAPMLVWAISNDEAAKISNSVRSQIADDIKASLGGDKDHFTLTLPDPKTVNLTPTATGPVFKTYAQLSMLQSASEKGSSIFDKNDGSESDWTPHYPGKIMKCIPVETYHREVGPIYWKRRMNQRNLDYYSTTLISTEPMLAHMKKVSKAKQADVPKIAQAKTLEPLGGLSKVILRGLESEFSVRQYNAFSLYWGETTSAANDPAGLYSPIQSSSMLLTALDPGGAQSFAQFMSMMVQQGKLNLDPMLYVADAPPLDSGGGKGSDVLADLGLAQVVDTWVGGAFQLKMALDAIRDPHLRDGLRLAGKWMNGLNRSERSIEPPAIEMQEIKPVIPIAAEVDGMASVVSDPTLFSRYCNAMFKRTALYLRGRTIARENGRASLYERFSAGAGMSEEANQLERVMSEMSKVGMGMAIVGAGLNVFGIVSLAERWKELSKQGAWGVWQQVSGVTQFVVQAIHDLAFIARGVLGFAIRRSIAAMASEGVEGGASAATETSMEVFQGLDAVLEVLGAVLNFVFGVIAIVEGIVELIDDDIFDGVMDLIAGICFIIAAFDPEPISKAIFMVLAIVIELVKFLVGFFKEEIPDSDSRINQGIKDFNNLAVGLKWISDSGNPGPTQAPDWSYNDAPGGLGDIHASTKDAPADFLFTPPPRLMPKPLDPNHPVTASLAIAQEAMELVFAPAGTGAGGLKTISASPNTLHHEIRIQIFPPVLHQQSELLNMNYLPTKHPMSPDNIGKLADMARKWRRSNPLQFDHNDQLSHKS